MEQEKKQAIALMRYSVISPVIHGLPDGYASFAEYYRKAAEQGIMHPSGEIRFYTPKTFDKWHRLYKKGGFDALMPEGRSDEGKSRKLDEELQATIRHLREEHPRLPASELFRKLREDGLVSEGELSESTVYRFTRTLDLERKLPPAVQDMRRYERPHINEVWCGDSSAGPYLKEGDGKKRRVYIIALIDDASRFIVGIDVFFHDNFVNLMSVMKSAIAKYGCPEVFNFDNGSAYKNRQMMLLAARIGSVVHYCKPYTPTAKAKIERWFRTLKDHWMATLDMRDFRTLDQLRGSIAAYVHSYNLAPHSSLAGVSPQDRFFSEPEKIRRLTQERLDRDFLLELERRVSPDCVISIDQVQYEVDSRFARQRIRLRYSPDMQNIFVVEKDGGLTPIRLLNKQDNANVKREKFHLSGGES